MPYWPERDNPDLHSVDKHDYAILENLASMVDDSSAYAVHKERCGCHDAYCEHNLGLIYGHQAKSDETLGWIVSQGLLSMDAVRKFLRQRGRFSDV